MVDATQQCCRTLRAALALLAFVMLALTAGHTHDGGSAGTGGEAVMLGQAGAGSAAAHAHGKVSHDHGVVGCGPIACSGLLAMPLASLHVPTPRPSAVRGAGHVPHGRVPAPPYKPPRVRA